MARALATIVDIGWNLSPAVFPPYLQCLLYAANATLVALIVFAWTHRRRQAVMAGLIFTACAVLTEAVSGIVGIADALLGVRVRCSPLVAHLAGMGNAFRRLLQCNVRSILQGERAGLRAPRAVCRAACRAAHPPRTPARIVRAAFAFVGAAAAFYLYVELRKRWFPSPLPTELSQELPADANTVQRLFRGFLVWFHQAPLPRDPLNNPLIDAGTTTGLRVRCACTARGLGQLVLPYPLSGDYSYPQEPIPERLVFPESVAGAALTAGPLLGSAACAVVALICERRERRGALPTGTLAPGDPRSALRLVGLCVVLVDLVYVGKVVDFGGDPDDTIMFWRGIPAWVAAVPVALLGIGFVVEGLPPTRGTHATTAYSGAILVAIGLAWVVVSYLPHSNIPVLLPTVRAERFWYFPAIGLYPCARRRLECRGRIRPKARNQRRGGVCVRRVCAQPVLLRVPACDGLQKRPRLLASHQERCSTKCESAPELFRHEGRPRRPRDAPRRESDRPGLGAEVAHGARLYGRHTLPPSPCRGGVALLP